MPASETVDFEREFAELVRELRAIPTAASPALRERVRALGEPQPRRPRISRRTLLVLAPACVIALAAGAVLYSAFTPSSTTHRESFGRLRANPKTTTLQSEQRGVHTGAPDRTQALPLKSYGTVLSPNPHRYQNYQASLRVPVSHVQAAMIKLAALGTVVEQHVSIQDLNAVVTAQRQRILQLKVEIARITAALQQSLPADVRLRLEFQLDEAKRSLAGVTGANKSTLRAAAMSRIALALTT